MSDRVGIEMLAATPLHHDLDIANLGRIGSRQQLRPSLSHYFTLSNAHGATLGRRPQMDTLFEEETRDALAITEFALADSAALTIYAGIDIQAGRTSCG